MKLQLIANIYNEHVKDHSDLFNFFVGNDFHTRSMIRKLYKNLTKTDADPERSLTTDEMFEIANVVFNFEVYHYARNGAIYSSAFDNTVKDIENNFKDKSTINLLKKTGLFNKENFKKVYDCKSGSDKLFSKLSRISGKGELTQNTFDDALISLAQEKLKPKIKFNLYRAIDITPLHTSIDTIPLKKEKSRKPQKY